MEHSYTDYLFILSIYGESISLDKLLFHIDGKADPASRAQALEALAEMEGKGLVALTRRGGEVKVRLTGPGRRLAEKIAGYMADNMVSDWHTKQLEFPAPPPGNKAANY